MESKRDGTFGNPVTSTLILNDNPLFDDMNEGKCIFDLDSIETFEIKPLK